jgi:hypothetical protein
MPKYEDYISVNLNRILNMDIHVNEFRKGLQLWMYVGNPTSSILQRNFLSTYLFTMPPISS